MKNYNSSMFATMLTLKRGLVHTYHLKNERFYNKERKNNQTISFLPASIRKIQVWKYSNVYREGLSGLRYSTDGSKVSILTADRKKLRFTTESIKFFDD